MKRLISYMIVIVFCLILFSDVSTATAADPITGREQISIGDDSYCYAWDYEYATRPYKDGLEITGLVSDEIDEITALDIPTYINGWPVLRIADEAFKGNTNIYWAAVSFDWSGRPDRLTEIGDSAFENCTTLAYSQVLSNIETVGKRAFYNTGITNAGTQSYLSSIGDEAFASCPYLSSFYLYTPHLEYADVGMSIFDGADPDFYVEIYLAGYPFSQPVLPATWHGYKVAKSVSDTSYLGVYEDGIYYPSTTPEYKAFSAEDENAYIDLGMETLCLPDGFAVKGYSLDGGNTWKIATLTEQAFAKLFDKGFTLSVTDGFDSKSKKTTGQILSFPEIQKRPKANKDRLVINYSICSQYGSTGGWTLSTREGDEIDIAEYQVAPSSNGKTPNARKPYAWGEFSFEGIPVKASGTPKTAYLVRSAPIAYSGIYVAASKPFKVTPLTMQKAPKYKPDYKKEIIKLAIGDAIYGGDVTEEPDGIFEPEIGDYAFMGMTVTPETRNGISLECLLWEEPVTVTIWKMASAKKPASERQKITLAPRAGIEPVSYDGVNGKISLPRGYEVMKVNDKTGKITWGGLPKITKNVELYTRVKSTAKQTATGYTGSAASYTEVLSVEYGSYKTASGATKEGIIYADIGAGGTWEYDDFVTMIPGSFALNNGDGSESNPFVQQTLFGQYGGQVGVGFNIKASAVTLTPVAFTSDLDPSKYYTLGSCFFSYRGDPSGGAITIRYDISPMREGGSEGTIYIRYEFCDPATAAINEFISRMRPHYEDAIGDGSFENPFHLVLNTEYVNFVSVVDATYKILNTDIFRSSAYRSMKVIGEGITEIVFYPHDGFSSPKSMWLKVSFSK